MMQWNKHLDRGVYKLPWIETGQQTILVAIDGAHRRCGEVVVNETDSLVDAVTSLERLLDNVDPIRTLSLIR